MPKFATPEDEWRAYMTGTHPFLAHERRRFGWLPSGPRCKLCYAPFGFPGRAILRRYGYTPWEKNPNICKRCLVSLATHGVSGAEVELSMMFADTRGSSRLARELGTAEFTKLMHRFYTVAAEVLFAHDAILDKFVGDEVTGFFLPFMTGGEHARRAIEAAQALLRSTGHGSAEGPWIPLGAGVHTGTAFVGIVASHGESTEFTALGDPVNTAAHLASQAAQGEILVTDQAILAAHLPADGLEQRDLSLKGHPVHVTVLPVR